MVAFSAGSPEAARAARKELAALNGCTTRELPCGFSLVELVMVLLVMGILTAIAVPRFSSQLSIHSLGAVKTLIETELKAAQQEALATSTAVVFTISKVTHSYSVTASRDGTVTVIRSVELTGSPWHCSVGSLLEGDSKRSVDTIALTINGAGTFERDLVISLASGTATGCITVESATGQIRAE